jgi:predicted RNase H-like HicB family nuclease
MQYAVVFEKTDNNCAAYVPDLPGCIATGKTRDDVERLIREAIAFHIEGLREQGEGVPPPVAWAELVDI